MIGNTQCVKMELQTHIFYIIRHLQQKYSIRIEDIQEFSQLEIGIRQKPAQAQVAVDRIVL